MKFETEREKLDFSRCKRPMAAREKVACVTWNLFAVHFQVESLECVEKRIERRRGCSMPETISELPQIRSLEPPKNVF